MIDELTTTIKAQLYERVNSPLLSSFVLSWCGWNYKFLLVVFSGMSSYEKITFIEMNLFSDPTAIWMRGILYPLATTLLYIYVYPVPAQSIYRYVKIQQRELKKIQQSIDDESPLSKEQARKIRKEALENQLKYESEIDAKISENSRLKELISDLQQRLDKAETSRSTDITREALDGALSEDKFGLSEAEDIDLVAAYEAAKADSSLAAEGDSTESLEDYYVAREYLVNGIAAKKPFLDLRRGLVRMRVPDSIINRLVEDIIEKKSGG